ncbi:MAG: Ig-like domain-containing protein, partial [Gaiellaceae bacterium]
IGSYTFGTLNSNGGANFGGTQTGDHFDYTFGATTTAPTTARTVTATNGAGTTAANATYTINSDSTGPSVPAPTVTAGYYTSLSVAVSLGTVTDTGGSGPKASTYVVQRDTIGLSNGACGTFTGTWSPVTLTGGNDTGVTSGNCYRYREIAADNVGNSTTSGASNTAKVDTSAPSTPTLSFSGLSSNAYYDGSGTFWFRPAAGGTFTVTGASTDSESGIGSYTFGTLNSNGGANFGGSQTGDHFDYTFGATTTAPTTNRTVNSTNGAGTNSTNATYAINADTAGPAVPAPTVIAGYYTSLSVAVSLGTVTDTGGSGPKASTFTVERDTIGLSNGTCGTFTGSWSPVTLTGGNDTTVTSGNCYRYRELAADNVGNSTTSSASNTAKIDTSAPSTPALSFTGLSSNAYYDGSGTFWFRPSAGGTFTVTATSSDADSAIGGYTFGTLNSNGGANFGGSQTGDHYDYTFGATTTAPTTNRTVNSTNGAGTNSTNATYAINADTTAPSVPAPTVTPGYYTSLSVAVSLGTVTDTGGSGPKASTFTVERDTIGLSNGTCGTFTGSWSPVALTGGNDTGVTSGNCYRYREIAADNVGNSTTSSASNTAKVDTGAPTNSITLTNVSPAGSAYKSGTTIFYRGAAAGSFKLTNAVGDGVSGPASSSSAALGGTTAGWTHTPSTVSTPAGGPYDSNNFSWSAGSSSSPTEVLTGADNAGNTTASAAFTFTADSTAPSVTAPTVAAGYYTSLSVPVTKNGGSDGGSGLDASSSVLERDEIALTNGSCGTFTGSWSTVTLSGGADTSVQSGTCYRYHELLSDNVGNQGTSGVSSTAKVDTSAPSTPTLSFNGLSGNAYYDGSGTLYLRTAAGGTFTVTGSSTDNQSGVASYTFGTLNSSGGANFGGSQTGDHFDYTFDGTTTVPATARTVSATNGAGIGSGSASYSIASDTIAPSVTAPSVTAGYFTSLSVTVTKNGGSDGGAGVNAVSSVVERDEISLGNGACGTFPGNWSAVALSGGNDTTVESGKCYRYRELLSDRVGNQGTSGASNTAKVDTQGPSNSITVTSLSPVGSALKVGGRIYYRGSTAGGGSFKLTNTVADAESGPASSATAALGGTTSGWSHTPSTVSSPAGGPYESNAFSWSQGTSSSPTEILTGADGAGVTTAAGTLTFTDDSNAPTGGALVVNGGAAYSSTGSFAIGTRTDYTETQSATESGLASSTLTRESATLTNGSCGPFGSATTLVGTPAQNLATGCYLYTLTGTDNLGDSVSITQTVKVDTSDPSAPTFGFSNFTGTTSAVGDTVFFLPTAAGSFDVTASSSDGDSDIASYTFPSAASFGAGWSISGSGSTRTYSYSAGAVVPGTKTVTAVNNAGRTAAADFNVYVSDATPPVTSIECNAAACQAGYYTSSPVSVTLAGDDGPSGSGVDVIRYTIDGTDPSPVNGSDYLGAFSILTTTTVKFRAYDNLGNEEAVGSQLIRLDGTPPTLSLGVAEQPESGAQHVSGTTLYYRPGAAGGTFRVTATADDPQTAVDSVDFPAIANVMGGSSQTSAPYREDYTWNNTTSDSGSHAVVATNGAGATTNASFTLTPDSTAPSGQSLTLTGANAPYYGSAPVTFSLGNGSDGAAGLDAASATVTRETGTLSGDSCSGFTADGGTYTSPDTTVSGGHCYRYSFTIADNVGNASAPVTATAKVDTAAPSIAVDAPTELTGDAAQYYDGASKTLFFRSTGSGSFRLNSTSSDTQSAVSSVGYPDLSGVSGWSTTGTDSSWSNGAAAPGARNIVATDAAGNSAADTVTISADTAAPTAQAITLTGANAPYYNSVSVTFSLNDGSDGSGSGVDTSTHTVTRETGDLAGDSCSSFSADGGTFTSPDTSVTGGHCYRYTFTVADRVGNVSSAVTATAKVDTNAPSVSVTAPVELSGGGNQYYDAASQTQYFRPAGSGSFTLTATAGDGESGVSQIAFPDVSGVSGWSGSTGGADATSPYASPADYSWTSGAGAPGLQAVTATNGAAIDGSASITLAADSTSPSGQSLTLTGADAPYYGGTSVGFTLGDGSDGGAGLDTSARTVTRETGTLSGDACSGFAPDGGTYASPDTSVTGGHCYRYSFTIADRVGNVSAPVTATAKVDTASPTISLVDPGTPVNGTVALSATASDGATSVGQVTFEWSPAGASSWTTVSTDTTAPYTASWDTSGRSDGLYDLRATAIDRLSNTSADVIVNRRVDHTPPDTTIDSTPPSLDNDATPTFTFSSSESGSTFECRVDGASWSPCSTPHTASSLADGSHTFDVRATDAAGNSDASPASHTWSIDLGPPTVSITSPTSYINAADPSTYMVTATSPDGDVDHVDFFECSNASAGCSSGSWTQFDSDSTAPFAASWSTPASDGTRAIRAVAVDAALNTGAAVRTITIDRTAPSGVTVSYPDGYVFGSLAITASNGPDGDVNASTAILERQTGDLSADSCSSYAGWSPASSPDAVASAKCAQYRFRIADNAGNWTTATSGHEAKSDTAAPTSAQDDPGANLRQGITLTSAAGDTGGSGLASVAFQRRPAGGSSWTTIATDTGAPYSTPFDTTTVADGLYDFRTVATDVAGNAEASPVVVANRRIDNTAPSATMVSPGNPVRATVTLTSNTSDDGSGIDTVTYTLAPHNGSFNTQPASWDTTLGADGLYDVRVTATDAAGNATISALVTTRVDNTAPALTFSAPATGDTVSGTVALTASASDASPAAPPVTFAYKLHSDAPSAYTATGAAWNTSALPAGDGLYDVRARATDDANNTTTLENTSIRVDNLAPSVAITAPAVAINGSLPSPTSFSATASDPGGSGVAQVQFFECSNQSADCASGIWSPLGTVTAPGPYTVSWNIPATDGNHALAAVATDNAGHPSSDIRNVDVDRTAPDTIISGKPADPSNAASPSFTFTSSEAGSSFQCRIDSGSWTPCTAPRTLNGLTDNAHTFDVRATDAAGNTDASPDTWTWHRDTNAPTGTLNNPGANVRQSITLTSAESDPLSNGYASGLASVSFEYSSDGSTWAAIGTNSSAPFDNMFWNTSAVADGVYQLHVVVRDVAGNETTSAAVTSVRVDNTAPTTSQNDPGAYVRATKTLTGSAADSGSGVDHVDFQRTPAGGSSWTTIATDSTPGDGLQVSFDTTAVADGHYDLRTVAYDVAGNQAAGTAVANRLVDNTAPSATLNDPGAYLRGAVGLASNTSDPGGANASGITSVAYEYSTNGGSSWQPTGSTFDSTSVADGNVDLHVVATDAAGNTTTSATVTKLADNTKPSTSDNAPGGWHASPVTVTLTPGDAGSGVNVTEYSVDGNASYTVGTSVAIPAPADGSNDGAHTIAYFSVDNAGNIETVKSATVLIDATPPACPSCSAADYLRGTVTLSAGPAADGSGIKSVAFEYTDAGGSTWIPIGTDTTAPAPYTAAWDTAAAADGHYDLRILITDNADNVTTAALPDKVVDNTAPNVATVGAPTEGQVVSGTVGISASASDATSPVASVEFFIRGSSAGADSTAPFSYAWNTTGGADGAATIQIVVVDMAGNSTTSTVRNVTVDNVSPTPTLADPGQNLSGTISLGATSDGDTAQVDFERRPAGGGSWTTIGSDTSTPWGTSLDTTTLADGLYDFRAVATDGTGHTGSSALRASVRIDNTAPNGSVTAPADGATVGGTDVSLTSSTSDAGAGVASVAYELRATGGGSFSPIASASSAPFSATWDATTVATGSYDLRAVITDRAGNAFTAGSVTFTVDVTAPTVTLTSPGATIAGTVTLNASVSGNGADNVAFAATPTGGATWTALGTDTSSPWSIAYDTTKLTDGVYDLRAKVTDTLGNSSEDIVTAVRVDNTAPRLLSSSPADGSSLGSVNAIALVASEPAIPVGVTLDGGATVAPVVNGMRIDYNTGALGAGAHTLAGELQDGSGKRASFRVHFTVGSGAVEKNTSASSPTTATSSDGFGSATMPAGAWSPSGNDWIVLRIAAAAAPSGLTNGFGPGPNALDVSASWALSGAQVHEFTQPVEIVIHSSERGLVPATFDGTAWRVIHRVPTAGTLPSGWTDGFYTDASGFHVLTKHLSLFALLHDLEAPQAPQNIRGYVGPDGLTIRWLPGNDNSGTYDYVTLFSGSNDSGHFGPDYTAATVAGWKSGDSRIFRLQETDLAGNQSELAAPLVELPSLIGMTLEQAEAALAARGLTIGSVTVGGSGKPGTITGPEGLALAGQGSSVDVTVAGGASTSLVFKVVTAPKFKPAPKKKIAARIT